MLPAQGWLQVELSFSQSAYFCLSAALLGMGIVLPSVLNLHYVHSEVSVREVRAFEWPGSLFIGEGGSPLWELTPHLSRPHTKL